MKKLNINPTMSGATIIGTEIAEVKAFEPRQCIYG